MGALGWASDQYWLFLEALRALKIQYWEHWGKYWSTRIRYLEPVLGNTGAMGKALPGAVSDTGLYWGHWLVLGAMWVVLGSSRPSQEGARISAGRSWAKLGAVQGCTGAVQGCTRGAGLRWVALGPFAPWRPRTVLQKPHRTGGTLWTARGGADQDTRALIFTGNTWENPSRALEHWGRWQGDTEGLLVCPWGHEVLLEGPRWQCRGDWGLGRRGNSSLRTLRRALSGLGTLEGGVIAAGMGALECFWTGLGGGGGRS